MEDYYVASCSFGKDSLAMLIKIKELGFDAQDVVQTLYTELHNFNQEMIDKAHAHGIKCNVFYADEPEEAKKYLDMGIDTVLTNDYLKISTALNVK